MEVVKKYTKGLVEKGLLCQEYADKMNACIGKYAAFSLLCDANGCHYFLQLNEKGVDTPYNQLASVFLPYINGRCKVEYKDEEGKVKYTSAMYVSFGDDIVCDTTILTVLFCKCIVRVVKNGFSRIYIDRNSKCEIVLDENAMAEVYVADGGGCHYDPRYDYEKRIKVYRYEQR